MIEMLPMISKPPLILASTSASRRALLAGAGLTFTCEAARIDERAIESDLAGALPGQIALRLAEEKALEVSRRFPDAVIIGADQTLSLGIKSFHKPPTEDDARRQLLELRGQTHRLNSGIACVHNGEVLYGHVATADMTMRAFSDAFLDHYMAIAGKNVLSSVGCYQLEGPGIQLFERIEGDYFTILGLPLLPLLTYLRSLEVIDA
jgi:septum formation protein